MLSCLLTSCYRVTAKQADDYDMFREEMKEEYEPIYEFLPDISDKNCIEDLYLYYTSENGGHSYYTVYLNCIYSDEEYEKEEKRLNARFSDVGSYRINTDSFEYESISYDGYMSWSHVIYEYILFEKESSRIVYVNLLEDQIHGRSINIPDEYLPKELIEVRETNAIPSDNFYDDTEKKHIYDLQNQ